QGCGLGGLLLARGGLTAACYLLKRSLVLSPIYISLRNVEFGVCQPAWLTSKRARSLTRCAVVSYLLERPRRTWKRSPQSPSPNLWKRANIFFTNGIEHTVFTQCKAERSTSTASTPQVRSRLFTSFELEKRSPKRRWLRSKAIQPMLGRWNPARFC